MIVLPKYSAESIEMGLKWTLKWKIFYFWIEMELQKSEMERVLIEMELQKFSKND